MWGIYQQRRGVYNLLKPPYQISKAIWDEYYGVQMSGVMNMFTHPLIEYFLSSSDESANAVYSRAFEHFETNGNTEPLEVN